MWSKGLGQVGDFGSLCVDEIEIQDMPSGGFDSSDKRGDMGNY